VRFFVCQEDWSHEPKNGSSPHVLNRKMVIIVQHEQGRTVHSGSPAG
jgi:hypothetical protein